MPLATIEAELLANFGVMILSAPVLFMLWAILKASPVSTQNDSIMLLMMMAMIGLANGLISIDRSVPIYIKLLSCSGLVALILLFLEAVHLPFTTTARLAGFGQINGADLTLSDKRCAIVKRQLSAAGMLDRLQCIGEETIAVNTPSGKEVHRKSRCP